MARKYKILLIIFVLLTVLGFLIYNGNQTHYGISEGTYRMVTQEDSPQQPFIHFDMKGAEIRFVFGCDLRMSFAYRGTVTLNGRANLNCENSEEKWIFEVVDNNTLRFAQRGSSEFLLKEGSLQDGAIFQFVEE